MNDSGRLLFDENAQARRRLTLFAAIAGFVALACMFVGIGQSLQLRFLDLWYLIRGDREPSPQVVIVAIDGKSLNYFEDDDWPWSRDKHKLLIEKLQEAGAKVIGFDITFSQKNPEDEAFAAAMQESKNIVFGMVFNNAGDPSPPGAAPPEQIVSQAVPRFDVPFLNVIPAPGVETPSSVLAEAAAAFGHVVILPSSDGTLRQIPMLIRHGDRSYPSFSLQVARVYADVPLEEIEVSENHLRVGYAEIPILQTGATWINWTTRNLGVAFPTYSVVDVLRGDVGARELREKAILVGMTAEGLDDREFPFGWTLPGVVLHAAFLDNFFTLSFLRAPSWGIGLEIGFLVALAVVAIIFFPRLPTPWLLAVALVLLLSVLALSLYLFMINSMWWPPMYPALAVSFPFATTVFFKLRWTEKAKEAETAKVREAKSQVAEAVLEKGLAFQEKGSLDLAIATFSRLPMGEEMKTIYLNLGFDFQSRNRLDKALLCYKRVFDMDPNFGDVAQRIEALRRAGVGTQLGSPSLIGGSSSVPYSPPPRQTPAPAPIEETAVTGDFRAAAPSPDDAESSFVPTLPGASAVGLTSSPGVEPQPGNPGSRYRMIKTLGKGAMGEVLLMQDTKLDRKVAIKMMRPDLEMSSQQAIELRHRFVREAKTAGKLTHPNIVTIYDSFEGEDGVAYIVMEFVDGDTLKNFTRGAQLTVPQIKHVIIEASKGLQHAHDNGVYHRDVKPDNIMITPKTGVIKVMDFGIARVVESSMTATGSILGTPAYMSPEQVSGRKVDGRSDLFSLGVVLYELLVGRRPFDGAAPTDVMFSILQKEPPPPSTASPGRKVSAEWDPIIHKALAKKPETRYQSVQELAKVVRAVRG